MPKNTRNIDFWAVAEQDLEEIWIYSLEEWGLEQADKYVADIHKACGRLANYPYLGPACDDIDDIVEDCREYGVGRHIIYYLPSEHTIEVVRILHVRMDARRHLQSL